MKSEIKKVLKQGDKKIVIIPKNCKIKIGNYVRISPIENEIKKSTKKLMEGFIDE